MATHKIGDTVQLKSGGPVMTINGEEAYGDNLLCVWFAGTVCKEGSFHPDALAPAGSSAQPEGVSDVNEEPLQPTPGPR
ncbi:MAG: DUF2158 domain-containing protein [Alphaproteobacteria bacterium]|nr:DUF2158 domain-containing protein [Alphaproteobacteria bacterium]